MDINLINNFSKELVTALEYTQNGQFIKNQQVEQEYDLLTIDIGPLEIPQYPLVDVKHIERVSILVKDGEMPCILIVYVNRWAVVLMIIK